MMSKGDEGNTWGFKMSSQIWQGTTCNSNVGTCRNYAATSALSSRLCMPNSMFLQCF